MEEDVAVIHFLSGRNVAGLRITSVVKARTVRQPGNAGRAGASDLLRQQLAGGRFNYAQTTDFRPVGRGAIGHVFAVTGGKPPVKSDSAIRRQLIHVNQAAIFSIQSFTHVNDRLVLLPFTLLVEVIIACRLRRLETADAE